MTTNDGIHLPTVLAIRIALQDELRQLRRLAPDSPAIAHLESAIEALTPKREPPDHPSYRGTPNWQELPPSALDNYRRYVRRWTPRKVKG
jgi:hypothetical protein